MTVASNGAGTCSPTSKLTTQSARGSESGIVRSNQLTKPSVYSSTFPAPSYAVQSRSGSSLRSRCPYWPKSLNVVLRAKPTLAHSSTPSCAFPRTAGKTPSARRSITGLSLTLAPHQQARGSTRGTGEACTTRATHNARSQLALSRFSSGRPTPAPRCKGISLHRTAPCTARCRRTSLHRHRRCESPAPSSGTLLRCRMGARCMFRPLLVFSSSQSKDI